MKFPITRVELQSYDDAKLAYERKMEEVHNRIDQIILHICKDFERNASSNLKAKQYVCRNHRQHCMNLGLTDKESYSLLLEKLQATFVDCTFIEDPLKTYLIIGWE
jgi:hypothetical protein